ncbi:FxsA family protein [Streptacidiphilus sp. N1-12]|uniref:FxsA family protein n=2 Tax=Streptacidiphilus alkalitolerans TaxID=3342712 RepID=A0ABV6WH84_9ACTN
MSQVRVNARRPRRGLSRFLPLAVAAWVVLEIWLLILLAGLIGGFGVVGVLVVSALLGGWVIKRAGMRALRSTTAGMRGGLADTGPDAIGKETRTAVTIAGGALLILPGLLSDLLGLACLFPPTAALLRRFPERWVRRSTEQFRIHRPDGKVVPGEVVEPDGFTKNDPYGYNTDRDQLH